VAMVALGRNLSLRLRNAGLMISDPALPMTKSAPNPMTVAANKFRRPTGLIGARKACQRRLLANIVISIKIAARISGQILALSKFILTLFQSRRSMNQYANPSPNATIKIDLNFLLIALCHI
jgi:hypothetical protein